MNALQGTEPALRNDLIQNLAPDFPAFDADIGPAKAERDACVAGNLRPKMAEAMAAIRPLVTIVQSCQQSSRLRGDGRIDDGMREQTASPFLVKKEAIPIPSGVRR